MKKMLLFAILLFLSSPVLFGQESQSVLWEISGKGLQKKSYLLGTIHIAPISLFDTFPQLAHISESCDFAIFESGGSPIGNAPIPTESAQPPLDSLFTPEEYAMVDSFFTASPHGSIRPHNDDADLAAMIQVAITINQQHRNTQFDSFDDLIKSKMIALGKPVFHLDIQSDIEEIKERISYPILAKFLVLTIKEKASLKTFSEKKEIDLELYSKTMTHPLKLGEKVDKVLENVTIDRNAKWLPKIEYQMALGSCFIAVGMGHLQYQTGLIKLLRNKGYTLKPVNL